MPKRDDNVSNTHDTENISDGGVRVTKMINYVIKIMLF
jgi:hypothetical protein